MMANLAALQHQMQSVILRRTATAQHGGSTTSYQVPRDDLLSQLRPPAHAQTDAMLDIYCNAYRSRLAEVLEADLANLSAYLGKALFEHAAAGYIEAHPSDRQNVRWFSRNMPDFLAATAPFSNWPQMAEVARIELALADAFDSANAETFSLAMLTSISPDDWATLMVVPHPSVRRIDALNFTMEHDDGQLPTDIDEADIVLVGISRTSKTPTSIYLANRGIKTANIPIVLGVPMPLSLIEAKRPLVVGLVATAERISQVRQNRLLGAGHDPSEYVDRSTISAELTYARQLCTRHGWPMIDVSRRSIEETAAAIVALRGKAR